MTTQYIVDFDFDLDPDEWSDPLEDEPRAFYVGNDAALIKDIQHNVDEPNWVCKLKVRPLNPCDDIIDVAVEYGIFAEP